MTLAELVVKLDADIGGLESGFTAAQRAANKLGERLRDVGTILTVGLTLPIAAFAAASIKAAADLDSLMRGLTAVSGGAEAAREEFTRLKGVAALPGLGLQEAVQGSINLQAAGFSASTARRALLEFGNALATVGKGRADLEGVITALSQMASKGKISAEELNQLAERVPQIRVVMKEAFGTVDTTAIQKAGIDVNTFVTRTLDALGKLPRVAGGVANEFENLSDSFFQVRAAIGEQLLPAVVPLLQGLASLLERVRNLNPETVRAGIAFAAVAAAIGPVIIISGSLVTAISAISAALSIGLLPLIIASGPIVIGLGIIAAAFVKTGLDALSAAADANAAAAQFKAALAQMNDATLQARFETGTATINNMMRARNTLMERLQVSSQGVMTESARNLSRVIANQQGLIDAKASELQTITAEIHARQAAALTTTRRPVIPPGGAGSSLESAREQVAGLVRETEALSRFGGVRLFSDLPDDITQAVSLVGSLTDRVDDLRQNIGKLGASAPSGANAALDQMNAQLTEATRRLGDFERLWRDAAEAAGALGRVDIRLPSMDVSQITAGINVEPRAGRVPTFEPPDTGIAAFAKEFIGSAGAMLAQFGPMALALAAVSRILQPLQPLLDALLVPFTLLGEIIAISLVPILRLLFPIIKAVAIVFALLQEATDRVIGTLLKGIGWFVRAIGKIINFLDPFGNPGNGLVRLGENIRDSGSAFLDAADEIAKKRKELEKLSFDDALSKTANAANRLTESILNAVDGFKVARFRFAASDPQASTRTAVASLRSAGAPAQAGGGGASVSVSYAGATFNFNVSGAGDPDAVTDRVIAGFKALSLSVPEMRPWVATLPAPGFAG